MSKIEHKIAPLIIDLQEKIKAFGNNVIVISDRLEKPKSSIIRVTSNIQAAEKEISEQDYQDKYFDMLKESQTRAWTVQSVGSPVQAETAYGMVYGNLKPGDRVIVRRRQTFELQSVLGIEILVIPFDAIQCVFNEPVPIMTLEQYHNECLPYYDFVKIAAQQKDPHYEN